SSEAWDAGAEEAGAGAVLCVQPARSTGSAPVARVSSSANLFMMVAPFCSTIGRLAPRHRQRRRVADSGIDAGRVFWNGRILGCPPEAVKNKNVVQSWRRKGK